jgi:hypothetical protein
MRPQSGGRPPPRNAGGDLPIERLPDRLDHQSISPNPSAQRATVPAQNFLRERSFGAGAARWASEIMEPAP